jgi:hypothetical protein
MQVPALWPFIVGVPIVILGVTAVVARAAYRSLVTDPPVP